MTKRTLQNYIDEVNAVRYLNSEKMLRISRQMASEAKKDDDGKALAHAEYFFLEANYRMGKLDETMLKRAVLALQLAQKHRDYDLECRILNMLGIFFLNQGDCITAMEYYQMGMECATKHHYRGRMRVMANNIGDLFMRIGSYEEALSYLEECYAQAVVIYEEGLKTGKEELSVLNLNVYLLNIATCHFMLEDIDKSVETLKCFLKDRDGIEEAYYGPGKDALMIRINAKLGCLEQSEDSIETVIKAAEAGMEAIEMAEDYLAVCKVLFENDRLEQALRLYVAMKNIAEQLDLPAVWCSYYETSILFAKRMEDTRALITAYENYMVVKKRQDEYLEKQQHRAILNRQALNKALKKQKKAEEAQASLKHMSEHDPLTGVYNRYVLNRECDRWWKQALEKSSTIGIIVMDIDYFKQYNDSYGHLQGDYCIKAVSEVICGVVGNKGIVVRYGGDEFFILLYGMETEDVLALSLEINNTLRKCEIFHQKSLVSNYVTVSQGIANGVPKQGESMADWTHFADNALYRAKEKQRGSVGVFENESYRIVTGQN